MQKEMGTQDYIFISLTSGTHSRSKTYYSGLKLCGEQVTWLGFGSIREFVSNISNIRRIIAPTSRIVIASHSHVLVPLSVLFLKNRPIFDAGWPLIDGNVFSRREYGFLGLNFIKTCLIDLLAFHLSRIVFLESTQQVDFVSRIYLVPKSKLNSLFTGVDETRFPKINRANSGDGGAKSENLMVLFRGGNQIESGLSLIVDLIRTNDGFNNIDFCIISKGISDFLASGPNVRLFSNHINDELLSELFRESSVVFGQLSKHPRLQRTIPHKFFEAAFFGKTYVSADTKPLHSLIEQGAILAIGGGSEKSLTDLLESLSGEPEITALPGKRLKEWYELNASQEILTKKFIGIIESN